MYVLRASAVKWWMIPLIDTLHWHLIDTQLTLNRQLGWHSIDTPLRSWELANLWLMHMSWLTLGLLLTDCWSSVDQASTAYWPCFQSQCWSRLSTQIKVINENAFTNMIQKHTFPNWRVPSCTLTCALSMLFSIESTASCCSWCLHINEKSSRILKLYNSI